MAVVWKKLAFASDTILKSLLTAKGNLISASAASTPAIVAISGNDGYVLTEDAVSASGMKWAVATGGTGGGLSVFGDGSDGVVTISGNTTLTRDMYYSTLTVNNGITLNGGSYRIFCSSTLTNNGTISRNGNAGGNASSATGGTAGAALAAGSLGGSTAGATGASTPNLKAASGGGGSSGGVVFIAARIIINNGTISANGGDAGAGYVALSVQYSGSASGNNGNNATNSLGGATSVAGNATTSSGTGTGGTASTATAPAATEGSYRAIHQAILLRLASAVTQVIGGAGAPSGGLSGYLTTQAAAGGSSGGGGGLLVFIYNTTTWGTETVNGGTKSVGLATGAGASATNGADGSVGAIIKIANI